MKKSRREKKGKAYSRREFLKTSLTGAAAFAIGSSIGPSLVKAAGPIKFGLCGVTSGAGGMSGEATRNAFTLWAEGLNKKGGLLGRQIEIIQRDTQNKPEEGVRFTREFANRGDIDFIIPHGSSSEAFAVLAVAPEIKRLIGSSSETTEYTADPKVRSPYCFRFARNCLHDGLVAGKYAAEISKKFGLTRWYTIAGDFAWGRDLVGFFIEYLKKFNPKVEVVGQAWPKLFEPDFTPQITAMLATQPHAVYNGLWGGDICNFVKQGEMYGISEKAKFFYMALSDYLVIEPIVKALGKLPAGIYAGTRYSRGFPDTKANHEFHDAYTNRFGIRPLNWSWEWYTAALLIEAAVKKAGTTENNAVISALKDLSVKAPTGVGPGGTVTMRGRDHQLINYAVGWGVTVPGEPYLANIVGGSWEEIIQEETIWLKKKGWL